jgi:hypothetical protein
MAGLMRLSIVLSVLLGAVFAPGSSALSSDRSISQLASGSNAPGSTHRRWFRHFVPNSQRFWDDSKHWTTNFGPAYRDTIEGIKNLVPCTGRYALCFNSGPEPLPCELDRSGRFANCKCTVEERINYVLITAILNYKVYLDTIEVCGLDGSDCFDVPDKAPVCEAIAEGKLIPGADLISTFSTEVQSDFATALGASTPGAPEVTTCPKGPYAGCMTAPCKETRSGDAVCSCPVFWGPFQLTGEGANCTLDDDLVNSASYTPVLDKANAGAGQ